MTMTKEMMEMVNKAAANKNIKGTDFVYAMVDSMATAEDKIYAERKDNFEYNARVCRHIQKCLINVGIRKSAVTDDMPITVAMEKTLTIMFNAVPSEWRPMIAPIIDELVARRKELSI